MGGTLTSQAQTRELLDRVANSPQFQKSKRLRELLLYLGDRAIRDPNCVLREQEIGIDVLGRPRDYDTSHDTLVRVLISHLRKKLQEYFAAEGRDESLLIEIPKGTYLPVFRLREPRNGHTEIVEEPPPAAAPIRGRRLVPAVLAAVAAAAVLGWATGYNSHPARLTSRPSVEAFWKQLFGNGQPTNLAMSDVTLMEFEILMGGPVQLSEYEAREWDRLADSRIQDPVRRELARAFVDRVTTAISDVQVARDFGVLSSELHLPLNIISARDLSSPLVSSDNTILLGSWRANPWVGLFEDQTAFRAEYEESPPRFQFVNRTPLPGEEPAYVAQWRRTGYCRVTFLQNPRRNGNTLLITGSDVISTEAGGRFIASEDSILQLRKRLNLKAGSPIPHFEVLLRAQIVNSTVPRFELVAYRPH